MNEANLSEMARMLTKERLARADRARLARYAKAHQAVRKTRQAGMSRTACRGSEQAAY